VSQHGAATAEGLDWTIIAGSATGELAGLQGTARVDIDGDSGHHFVLDYELA
jgi:hypothetical protein